MLVTLSPLLAFHLAAQTPTVTLSGSGNTPTLRWMRIPMVNNFTVERRQVSVDSRGVPVAGQFTVVGNVTGFGFTDVVPTPSVTYEYQVSGIVGGKPYPAPPVQYVAPAFTTVTNFTITGAGTRADLAWTAALGVGGYQIWRRTVQTDGSVSGPQLLAGPLPAPGFSDPSLTLGKIYEYQVVSVALDGSDWPSGWLRYATPPAPAAAVAPTVTVAGAGDRVLIAWTATAGATGYQIKRFVVDVSGQSVPPGQIVVPLAQGDTYLDVVPTPAPYRYEVSAILPDGSAARSAPADYGAPAFTTPVGVGAAALGLRGVVTWHLVPGVVQYQVWRRLTDYPAGKTSQPALVGTAAANANAWLDGLPDGKSFVEYQVVAISADGRSWPSAWIRGR